MDACADNDKRAAAAISIHAGILRRRPVGATTVIAPSPCGGLHTTSSSYP